MTEASEYLVQLARRSVQPYAALSDCRAILLTGSAAEGRSDFYSDIDLIVFFDELPPDADLEAARLQNGTAALSWQLGEREEGELIHS
jgi:predicted nucleotidyltransferase